MTHGNGATAVRSTFEIITEARAIQARHGAATLDKTVRWLREAFSRHGGEHGTRPETAR